MKQTASNWGCVEEREDNGKFVAYHIMPMIQIDGQAVVSAAHDSNKDCVCHPFAEPCGDQSAALNEQRGDGKLKRWIMYQHHEPEHKGALSEDEYIERKAKAAGIL